jgi:CYTH domain-containing protein
MAKELDKKLINAWIGHPHFSIIANNHENFQKKVDQAVETVCNYIGMPTPTSFYKKFLIRARGQLEIQLKQIKGEQIKMEYF